MLNRIEEDYNKFRKKEYQFILENGEMISLKFKKANLPHLIGIGKLKEDDETIKKFVNNEIYAKDILDKLRSEGKTYETLSSYPTWSGHLTRRMSYFQYSNINLLIRQAVVIDFVFNSKNTKNDKAKFIFYAETEEIHLHLFVGKDELKKFYFPNSFTAECKKDRNAGGVTKIKVSKVIVHDGKEIEVINHDYYKSIIRTIRSQMKEINKCNVNLKNAISKGKEESEILMIRDKLNEMTLNIELDFKEIDKYVPIDDFLRLKNNNKIKKFYRNLVSGSYIL